MSAIGPKRTWAGAVQMSAFGGKADMEMTTSLNQAVPRLKISHRLFAARCVAAIIDRGRLLSRRYRPKPRLCLRCLRVAHDAPDYWSAFVTEPHIIVVLVPKIRATAFAGRYKNQIDFRMWYR
jgi:hypothetical protein